MTSEIPFLGGLGLRGGRVIVGVKHRKKETLLWNWEMILVRCRRRNSIVPPPRLFRVERERNLPEIENQLLEDFFLGWMS